MTSILLTTQSFENSKLHLYFECHHTMKHPQTASPQSIRMNVVQNMRIYGFSTLMMSETKVKSSSDPKTEFSFSFFFSNSTHGLWLIILWVKFHSNFYENAEGERREVIQKNVIRWKLIGEYVLENIHELLLFLISYTFTHLSVHPSLQPTHLCTLHTSCAIK